MPGIICACPVESCLLQVREAKFHRVNLWLNGISFVDLVFFVVRPKKSSAFSALSVVDFYLQAALCAMRFLEAAYNTAISACKELSVVSCLKA